MLPTGDKTVVSTRVFSRAQEGAGRLSLSSFYKVTNKWVFVVLDLLRKKFSRNMTRQRNRQANF